MSVASAKDANRVKNASRAEAHPERVKSVNRAKPVKNVSLAKPVSRASRVVKAGKIAASANRVKPASRAESVAVNCASHGRSSRQQRRAGTAGAARRAQAT